ncbi:hypothetical protein FC99_GL001819 [Levilactobacillus koreensis JCM 16448]|uniref:Glycosyltransferase 2-like domain-containing protein n=1 Tax=Levilactobacillus koreensis TaxID=637971 RepID=A0AAC8ZGV1_9LACO|nr:glycosyltransferase family A protein [Levilactobacillus koreensis]AKP65341.1 hypothetical protein ABN16_10225 [Levilactobacillus koreensis]KRK86072.1 hypothetical protein FC99_GL001819 [Levilactobacillus koreensis JCM 16448]
MKVSVMITTHDNEKYISACLDSVLLQTYRNLEILVIDDGSTDNTVSILNDYARRDRRIRIISQSNQGISAARNNVISNASCEYLTFVDGDDVILPDYIEYLVELVEKFHVELATCTHESIQRGANVRQIKDPKEYVLTDEEYFSKLGNNDLPYQLGVAPWGRLYAKKLFDHIRYPVGKKFEDSATTYKIILAAGSTAVGEKIKYVYYRNSASIVQNNFDKSRFQFLDAEKKMHDDVIELYPKLLAPMNRRYRYALMNTLGNILASGKRKEFKDEVSEISSLLFRDYWSSLFDTHNSSRDVFGLISLGFGARTYGASYKLFKRLKR